MNGIDPEQAGRDWHLMLSGHAGAQVATFNRLQAQIGHTADDILEARRMRAAGFGNVAFRNMTMGVVALHTGWRL